MKLEEVKKIGLNTTIRDLQALYRKIDKKVGQLSLFADYDEEEE